MKIAEIAYFNPKAGAQIGKLPFINYIDTAAVVDGVLEGVQELQKDYPSRAQRELRNGDILISSVRPNLKHNYFVDIAYDNMVGSTGFIQIRPNNPDIVDAKFLYYFLTAPFNVARYVKIADTSQSAYPSFNKDVIEEMDLPGVDITKQRKIGSLLSTIDRKIALNRKRIATLEAMAKEIYDYWFVQFDFPDAHGRPYKSSGGAMVYNPDLKREIPKGWEVRPLGDIAEVVNGATPSTANPRNYDGDVVWITPKDLSDQRSKFTYGGNRTISREGYDSCSTHMLPRGSILMSSRAPIGLLSIAAVDLCTNQGFKSFVPKEIDDNLYLYYYLKEHMAQVEAMGSGTTFKEVSRESMISFPIPYVSDRKVYASFVAIAKPIFNQQELLGTELARLSALRDFLLPVLMNGQVKVG